MTPSRRRPDEPPEGTAADGGHVVDIDVEHSLILVKGAVPGSNGSVVFIKDAVKRQKSTKDGEA